jgi:type II secretory pathway pseudopilin PulG
MNKGYSLIEAVIAVSILAIVISTSLTIILTATETEESNQDFLIGNMLAIEGIERVKNIYYTNALKFGEENMEACSFVHTHLTDDVEECGDPEKQIGDDSYLLEPVQVGNFLNWKLTNFTGESITIDGLLNPSYQLYTKPEDADLSTTNMINMYFPLGEPADEYTPTEFHREIIISGTDTDNINIVSVVGWLREDGNVRTITNELNLPKSL